MYNKTFALSNYGDRSLAFGREPWHSPLLRRMIPPGGINGGPRIRGERRTPWCGRAIFSSPSPAA